MKALLLPLALGLASCSGGAASEDGDGDRSATSTQVNDSPDPLDGPVMRYPAPSSSGEGQSAEVRGVLQLEGTCLYVFLDEVGERYPLIWPAGTTWDEESQSVIPPEGPPMSVGSQVYGGGGYSNVDVVERLVGSAAAALASSCVDNTYGEVALVNNQPAAIGLANE